MNGIYWPTFFFLLFSGVACAFAIAVVMTPNVVRMAFYLVMSLAATAGLFFLAGADFVGAMQLMIYVGGTLVLLIFGVMLTSQEQFVSIKTGSSEWTAALLVGASLLFVLWRAAFAIPEWGAPDVAAVEQLEVPQTATPLGMALLGLRTDNVDGSDPGKPGYLMLFEIVSVHLLVVLVGAAYLARAKKKQSPIPA